MERQQSNDRKYREGREGTEMKISTGDRIAFFSEYFDEIELLGIYVAEQELDIAQEKDRFLSTFSSNKEKDVIQRAVYLDAEKFMAWLVSKGLFKPMPKILEIYIHPGGTITDR